MRDSRASGGGHLALNHSRQGSWGARRGIVGASIAVALVVTSMIALPSASAVDDCSVSSYSFRCPLHRIDPSNLALRGPPCQVVSTSSSTPEVGPSSVMFFLDGGAIGTESVAPWDFGGGGTASANPWVHCLTTSTTTAAGSCAERLGPRQHAQW
jgi:hypothetical protein